MFLKTINNILEKVLYWFTAVTAFLFFFMVIAGVGSRYIFLTPIAWSIEISRLLFIWSCFLAAALTYRKKAHIAIGLLTEKLPKQLQYYLGLFRQTSIIMFMVLIFFAALETVTTLWFSALPVLRISQGWLYIPVLVASASIALFSIEDLLQTFKKPEPI